MKLNLHTVTYIQRHNNILQRHRDGATAYRYYWRRVRIEMGKSGNRGTNSKENCDSCNITDLCHGGFQFKTCNRRRLSSLGILQKYSGTSDAKNTVILLVNEQTEKLSSS